MIVHWTLYDTATGAVIRSGVSMDEEQAYLQETGGGKVVITATAVDPAEVYVPDPVTPVVTTKPAPPANMVVNKLNLSINGTDFIQVPNIPANSAYALTCPENQGITTNYNGTVPDGVFEFTTTIAGSYTLSITPPNTLPYTVTVNAN